MSSHVMRRISIIKRIIQIGMCSARDSYVIHRHRFDVFERFRGEVKNLVQFNLWNHQLGSYYKILS